MYDFTDMEKKVISALQGDIPVAPRPYKILAESLGMSEKDFIDILKDLHDRKIMRRFGATLWHQQSGFAANAMCAWLVDEDKAEEAGKKMALFQEVSHCYLRPGKEDWKYNLYTMIHAKDEETCFKIAERISKATSIDTYELLFSAEELKKTSMKYF